MPVDCQRSTSGGKGNLGFFTERDSRVCAAGLPTAQPGNDVSEAFSQYTLKDEVDALISDAIIPPKEPRPLPPLRHPIQPDKRNAGPFGDVASIINPPDKTKFESIVHDVKETVYKSYWKSRLGHVPDPTPMLPDGLDPNTTTFGIKTERPYSLYEVVMPKNPPPDKTPKSKLPGYQTNRNYCKPPFNPELTFGCRGGIDDRGIYAKCALTDDRVIQGTSGAGVINFVQANYQHTSQPKIGAALTPNENINEVPEGYSFGILKPPDNLPECLTFCEINPGREHFLECLKHLNCLRKVMSTRYLPTFFRKLFFNLKYYDTNKTGKLPKKVVYDICGTKFIRFNPELIEPLLTLWNAFDGENIDYKIFCHVLNYKEGLPELPKIPDFKPECLDFRTTYREMVKPGQESDPRRMAGLPSGRFFDLDYPITPDYCCRAHQICLMQESDVRSCVNPSVLTLLNVSHRDMFAKREPDVVRRVFEATGEKFTDESFAANWERAKKYHSQGWVSYQTFIRALENNPDWKLKP